MRDPKPPTRLLRASILAAALSLSASALAWAPPASTLPADSAAAAPNSRRAFSGLVVPSGPGTPAGERAAPAAGPADTILSTVLPLSGVLALVFLAAWVVRHLAARHGGMASAMGAGGGSPAGILEVLGRYPINRAQTLILLRVDRRVLLLAQSVGRGHSAPGMTTLADIADPESVASILTKVEEADGRSMTRQFQSLLDKAREGEALPHEDDAAGRRRTRSADGDLIETWDEPAPALPDAPAPAAPAPGRHDPVALLRSRLAAMNPGERAA